MDNWSGKLSDILVWRYSMDKAIWAIILCPAGFFLCWYLREFKDGACAGGLSLCAAVLLLEIDRRLAPFRLKFPRSTLRDIWIALFSMTLAILALVAEYFMTGPITRTDVFRIVISAIILIAAPVFIGFETFRIQGLLTDFRFSELERGMKSLPEKSGRDMNDSIDPVNPY